MVSFYTEFYRLESVQSHKYFNKNILCMRTHDGGGAHLELDILECVKSKWALGNIIRNKASGGSGIPAEPFKILRG